MDEFEISDRPAKKPKISKIGTETHVHKEGTSVSSKTIREDDQKEWPILSRTRSDDDLSSTSHLEMHHSKLDPNVNEAPDDRSTPKVKLQKMKKNPLQTDTKQQLETVETVESDDMAVHNRADIIKTTSRIKPRSNLSQLPSHHLEVTEISNGKLVDAKSSFATIDVAPWLIASLAAMEIRRPTAIQKSCIPEILKGRDVIGGSKTGSGKTVTFAVPIIQKWAEDPMGIYALILTPTR